MVTNYYNASNNFKAPIRREPNPFHPAPSTKTTEDPLAAPPKKVSPDQDTLLLLGVLLFLIFSDCSDKILLLALGYVLLF